MILTALRDVRWRIAHIAPLIVATAIVVGLAVAAGGRISALRAEPGEVIQEQGAQSWIGPTGASGPFSAEPSITAEQLAEVRDLADVLRADPVLAVRAPITVDGAEIDGLVLGVTPDGLGGISTVVAGSNSVGAGQLIVSRSSGAVIGNQVALGGEQLEVVGVGVDVAAFGGQPVVVGNIDDVRRLVAPSSAALASMIVIRGEAPNLPNGLVRFDQAAAERDLLTPVNDRISNLGRQRAVLWAVGGVLIGLAGWWLGRKRRRDFTVSKSYGVPARDMLISVVVQSVAMSVAAVLGGILVGLLLGRLGSTPFQLTAQTALIGGVAALIATVIASLAGLAHIVTARPTTPFAIADIAKHQPGVA
jgi:hypothetical protein